MDATFGWWAVGLVSLAFMGWAILERGGIASYLAIAADAATASAATLLVARSAPTFALDLLYAGFALGLASLAAGLVWKQAGQRAARFAAGWPICVPIALATFAVWLNPGPL